MTIGFYNFSSISNEDTLLTFPIGATWSLFKTASSTSKAVPYNNSFSKNTVGSGSRIAAYD